ncbi:MAG: hypothetical protein A2579_03195 [Lysobacterales bacterium RIFOXYD1_FULL_69_11]|nr:MAG: hypothetical protein A2579_03195 [Xanthomonadales bacterium RIFOXYD1_FULL_69_11]
MFSRHFYPREVLFENCRGCGIAGFIGTDFLFFQLLCPSASLFGPFHVYFFRPFGCVRQNRQLVFPDFNHPA